MDLRLGPSSLKLPLTSGLSLRGANQFPPGSPIPQGSTVLTIAPDSVAGSNITVQSLNTWTNNPTAQSWRWFFNGAPSGAVLTTAPTGLSGVAAGNWKLVSYAENAANAGNPAYANSNTLSVAAVDTTPNAFTFTDVANAAVSTFYESDEITVSGINRPAAISVTGGQYAKNGGAFTSTAGTVANGDKVKAGRQSSGSASSALDTVVTIGGVSDTFTVTTAGVVAPPAGGVSFVSQAAAPNASTIAAPAHQPGDLIVVFAYNSLNATAITAPSGGGWSNILNGFGNTNASYCAYKIATSSNEDIGTWANANSIAVHVYRGVDQTTPIGGSAQMTNVANLTYPAITMQKTDGTSWVAAFAGLRNSGTVAETPPAGMTNRSDAVYAANNEVVGHDTNGGVAAWTSTEVTAVTGFRYRSVVFEIRKAA